MAGGSGLVVMVLLVATQAPQEPNDESWKQKRAREQGIPREVHPPSRDIIDIPRHRMHERRNEVEDADTVCAEVEDAGDLVRPNDRSKEERQRQQERICAYGVHRRGNHRNPQNA